MRFRLWTTILGLCPISICFTVIDLSESVSPTKNKNYISRRGQLPKIELKSYIEVDSYVEVEAPEFQNVNFHQNDFVTKNGSEYIVASSAVTVVFTCRASYPIVWKLPNPEQFESFQTFGLKVSTERISEFTTDLSQPRNLEFRSYITFLNELYLYQTGYLSCESVTNSKLHSTIYVYAEGQNALAIATGQTVIVNLTETSSKITLPCRPSLPDISVSLAKQETLTDSDKTQWTPLVPNESIHFDPKIGFVLDVRTLPDIRGTYRCSVINEEDEKYCFVRVTSGNKMPYKFTPVSAIESHSASFSIKTHLVKCCTGKPNLPALGYYTSCENEAECDLMKPIVMHRYLTQRDTLLYNHERASSSNLPGCFNAYVQNYMSPSTILICQGEKLNVVGLISPIYKQELMNTTAVTYNNYELVDFANNPQEVGDDKKFSFILESRQRSDLVSQHYYTTRSRRLNLKRIYNPNIEYYPDMRGINIDIFVFRSGETIYEGEDIRITCFPLQYFYAKGGWLQLNWKNGSRMVIDSFDNLHPQDVMYRSSVSVVPGIDSKIRITGVINNIDLEVESVDCFAPIWNSVKWEKRTLKLKITPSAIPEFENPQDELITLKLNETGIYLNCSVVNTVNEQFVTTKLSWEKDGKRIFGWNENVGQVLQTFGGNITESSVELFIISHSSAGTYTCTASNVKGKAMKKFVVFVDDGKSKPTVIIIITVVCLSLLLTATTALVWKVSMVRMKLNNVTSR